MHKRKFTPFRVVLLLVALGFAVSAAHNFYQGWTLMKGDGKVSLEDLRKKAAGHGNADAPYLLGKLYFHGDGVEKNLEEAKRYYRQAAAAGHEEAKVELAELEK